MPMKNKPEENNDDFVIEEEIEEENSLKSGDLQKIQKLKKELKNCQKERQEYLNGWQRAKADYINLKKELDECRLSGLSKGKEKAILEFLPVLDNFNMAFANKEAWEKTPENWRLGIEHIYRQFNQALKDLGVEEIGQIGEEFNPSIHEALEMLETDDEKKDHTVLDVIRLGYKLNEKIIRPAQVKVANFNK